MADSNLEIGIIITGAEKAAAGTQSLNAGLKAVQVTSASVATAAQSATAATNAQTRAMNAATAAAAAQARAQTAQANAATASAAAQARAATAAANAQSAAVAAQARATRAAAAQARAQATTTNAANTALNQSRTATGNSAMGFLFLSQAIEDAQYGFGAVLNNIPLITMAFGGTAGLAGALSIAGVAVNALMTHFDIFGTEAAKAAEKAGELAESSKKLAGETLKEGKAHDANETALDSQAKTMDNLNRYYDGAIQKSKDLRAAKEAELKINQDAADADADLEDAEIDDLVSRGGIGEAGAAKRKAEVEQKRLDTAHKAAQDKQRIIREEASTGKASAEIEAKDAITAAKEKEAGASGMFATDAERKSAKDKGKQLSDEIDAKQAKIEGLNGDITRLEIVAAGVAAADPTGVAAKLTRDKIVEKRYNIESISASLPKATSDRDAIARRLSADAAAQAKDGNLGKSKGELQKEADDLKQKSYDAAKKAGGFQTTIDASKREAGAETDIYGKRTKLLSIQSGITSREFEKKTKEEADRREMDEARRGWDDKERADANAPKLADKARGEFADVSKMAGTSGSAGAGMKQAEAALEQFLAGNKESGAIYAKLIKMFMEANKTNMEVQKEAKEALAAAASTRSP